MSGDLSPHARRELDALDRVQGPPPVRATAILTIHQRRGGGSCLCGWNELGKSHPAHQVEMLCADGLLPASTTNP